MIAWIVYDGLDERTGGTIYDREIVLGLRNAGHVVELIAIARGSSPAALVRRLAQLRPEAIVGDELCFRELAFAFPRVPFARRILLVHHLTCWEEELPPRTRVLEMQALRAADFAVATSHATRARLRHEGYRGRVEVVQPGSDRLARAERSREGAVRFVFLGAVTARKRVRELVHALPPGAELRVVGSITREKRYAESVRAMASAAVTFLGEVDDDTVARELAAADALVMPSSLEGYGIAATEALAASLPVIAARTPGLEEALAPCANAVMLVDADADHASAAADDATQGGGARAADARRRARTDSDGLAHALQRFSTDAALRDRMRAAAREARLPTWARAVDAFAALVGAP